MTISTAQNLALWTAQKSIQVNTRSRSGKSEDEPGTGGEAADESERDVHQANQATAHPVYDLGSRSHANPINLGSPKAAWA